MGLLAETFRSRLSGYLQAHDPTRVLVGGFPDFLLEKIAASWASPFHLFLVSPGTGSLPANVQRCRADDLTAERQHGWAALVSVHESRGIQESIRSAGAGTVRELWVTGFPWHPCELPGARWPEVRNDFIDRLRLSGIRKDVAACIDQFREELRGEVDASNRFYSALDALTNAGITYADVCFQLGFPAHPPGRTLRRKGDREAVLALLDEFVERFKEDVVDDALEHFLDLARTHYAGDQARITNTENALKFFANEFRHLSPAEAENPVRAWRAVFTGSRANWEVLSADAVADLLGPDDQKPSISSFNITPGQGIDVIRVGDNQLLVRDRNAPSPSVTAQFEFGQTLVDQAAQAAAAGTAWRLFVRANRVYSQLANPLPPGKGPHTFPVALPAEGKQALRFSAGPNSTSERAASKTTTLWECCQEYPLILANSHSKLRAGKRKRSKDEQGNTRFEIEQDMILPAQGRVALHGLIYRLQGQLTATLPGESSPRPITGPTQIPHSLCQQFVLNVDVVEGAEILFAWTDASNIPHRATIGFEFRGEAGPRDDSLTGVLLRAHGGASSREIKNHLNAIKDGHQLPPGELSVRETGKPISIWEVHQQETKQGWWPILVSEGQELREQRLRPHPAGCFYTSATLTLNEQANAWRSVAESPHPIDPPPAEVSAYVNARTNVIDALAQQFKLAPGESIDEVNIACKAAIGLLDKDLLKAYVEAYALLLEATEAAKLPSSWRWLAWSFDSVLLFAPNATGPTAHLLGPFHPVTLARLFFVQQCLGERLLDDEPSPLAHIFAQVQPLALGHVLDAQLQPANAIAFPTGEMHWLWLYRQQGQSDLPAEPFVDWLRETGLDPQTGPLAVDAEVLPQTLKQYILAYPSHQALRLCLEDCSQQTFEVLRDELLPEETGDSDPDRLRVKLPGGIGVYDPITKVKRLDGQLLSYDPDLPLRWHHGKPPSSLTMDLSTLPRSNRVDFQSKHRGGASSSCIPTARRGLVEFTSAGLEVSTAVASANPVLTLENAVSHLLSVFEPPAQQLSWGTSLALSGSPKANWTLCSASQVDPRLFIEYVKRNTGTALWTYRLFTLGDNQAPEFGRGHFLVARVSPSLATGLQTQLNAIGLAVSPNDLLTELAKAGLTLGDEFLRTGRTAEGALGQYLVQQLLWQPPGQRSPLPHWDVTAGAAVVSAGSLLQVDPFSKVLDTLAGSAERPVPESPASHQRSDLVSIHLQFCGDELWIRPVVFESKYISSGQPDIENAVAQAAATATQFDHLLEFALHDATKPHGQFWAQPERLLLAEIIHLGLRLARGSFTGSPDEWHKFERRVLSKVLSGEFRRDNAQAVAIVHHPGPTVNNLAAGAPHAFVSFADANAAQAGTAPAGYLALQQVLADIVRHICSRASPPALPPPPTATVSVALQVATAQPAGPRPSSPAPRPPASPAPPPAMVEVAVGATTLSPSEVVTAAAPPNPPVPPQAVTAQLASRSDEITQAHQAFDRAFEDFIGNHQAIEKLRDDLVDALIKHPPHLPSAYLLTGNPSTGKTTLANKVAKLLGVTFVKLVGTNIRNEADLVEQVDNAFQASTIKPRVTTTGTQGLPEHEYPECLIFIDEIHLVKGRAQEGLLTLTEPKDRYVRLRDRICRFPRATYMAATTRDSEIDKALRTRFGNPIHLNDYSVQEVAEMLAVKKREWHSWPEAIRIGIAQLSRCIPREAERLAQKLERKMAVSRERLPLEGALEKLRVEEGLDRHGLDQVCWAALRHLAKQPRPVGRETLANQLGTTDEEKLVSELIPTLQNLGLVEQVAGGQKITDGGRNYLRNEAPPTCS
jgi:holliday junction DNA helicase RuvB